jgi:hypothetical protein
MPVWSVLRSNAIEKILQVVLDIGIGIFLDCQRCRSMPDKQGQQTFMHRLLPAPLKHPVGYFVQPRAIRFRAQCVRCLSHPLRIAKA